MIKNTSTQTSFCAFGKENVSTSAMQNFTFKPENAEMQFRMQVGKFEFVFISAID
jgi:hypothetical protein